MTRPSASAGEIAEAADIFLRGVGADTYRELIRARLGDNAYQQLVRDAEFFFDDELRAAHEWQIDDATHITAPTLLVHGRESQRYTRAFAETVERLAQMLPAADVLEIPGLSHAKPLEDPPAIARLIAKTVNQRTGRRP